MKLNIPKSEDFKNSFSLPNLVGLSNEDFKRISDGVDELIKESDDQIHFFRLVYEKFNKEDGDDAEVFVALAYAMDIIHQVNLAATVSRAMKGEA